MRLCILPKSNLVDNELTGYLQEYQGGKTYRSRNSSSTACITKVNPSRSDRSQALETWRTPHSLQVAAHGQQKGMQASQVPASSRQFGFSESDSQQSQLFIYIWGRVWSCESGQFQGLPRAIFELFTFCLNQLPGRVAISPPLRPSYCLTSTEVIVS